MELLSHKDARLLESGELTDEAVIKIKEDQERLFGHRGHEPIR